MWRGELSAIIDRLMYQYSRSGIRTVPRRTFPLRIVPRRHFPDGRFLGGYFSEWAIPRTDISPMDSSTNYISRTNISSTDFSPNKKVTDMNYWKNKNFYGKFDLIIYIFRQISNERIYFQVN